MGLRGVQRRRVDGEWLAFCLRSVAGVRGVQDIFAEQQTGEADRALRKALDAYRVRVR